MSITCPYCRSQQVTGSEKVNFSRTPDGVRRISLTKTCKRCGHESVKSMRFTHPKESLTVFDVGMLTMIFLLKKKPQDYACFHKSPAGKKFIEDLNIIEVRV